MGFDALAAASAQAGIFLKASSIKSPLRQFSAFVARMAVGATPPNAILSISIFCPAASVSAWKATPARESRARGRVMDVRMGLSSLLPKNV